MEIKDKSKESLNNTYDEIEEREEMGKKHKRQNKATVVNKSTTKNSKSNGGKAGSQSKAGKQEIKTDLLFKPEQSTSKDNEQTQNKPNKQTGNLPSKKKKSKYHSTRNQQYRAKQVEQKKESKATKSEEIKQTSLNNEVEEHNKQQLKQMQNILKLNRILHINKELNEEKQRIAEEKRANSVNIENSASEKTEEAESIEEIASEKIEETDLIKEITSEKTDEAIETEPLSSKKTEETRELDLININKTLEESSEPENTPKPYKTSKAELDQLQIEKLRSIRFKANTQAIHKSNQIEKRRNAVKKLTKQKVNFNLLLKIACLVVVITTIENIIVAVRGKATDLTSMTNMDRTNTMINVSMNNSTYKLNYDVDGISIGNDSGSYLNLLDISWIEDEVSTKSDTYKIEDEVYKISKILNLTSFDITKEMVYLQYKNKEETAEKELIVANKKPSNIDTSNLSSLNARFSESANQLQVITTANTYDNSFIMLAETVSGSSLIDKSLKDEIVNMESNMSTSAATNGIIINLDNVGEVSLKKINEDIEVAYNNSDDILQIIDNTSNEPLMYITNTENETLGYKAEQFIATNDDMVYLNINYNDASANGYKTILLKGENSLYLVKFLGVNAENTETEVFNQLGINKDTLTIKKIQRVLYTEEETTSTDSELESTEEITETESEPE
jgi:hypothetical protein